MLSALIPLLLLLALSLGLMVLTRDQLGVVLPTAALGAVLVLYVFGLVNLLTLGRYAVIALALAAVGLVAVLALRRRDLFALRGLVGWVLPIFVAAALVAQRLVRGLVLSSWDEFTQWGVVVRAMHAGDVLGPYSPVNLGARSYPPGESLFQYWVLSFGPWSESQLFWAYQLLMLTLAMPFLAQLRRGRAGWLVVALPITFLAPLVFFDAYSTTLVDALMALLFGYCLAVAYLYALDRWQTLLHLGVGLAVLVLVKDTGLVFALIVACVYGVRAFARAREHRPFWSRANLLPILLPFAVVVVTRLSWTTLLTLTHVRSLPPPPIGLQTLIGLFTSPAMAHQRLVLFKFVNAAVSLPISGGSLPLTFLRWFAVAVVGLIGVALLVQRTRPNPGAHLITLGILLGSGVYMAVLAITYMFLFGAYEGERLASFARYVGTYWAAIVAFVAFTVVWLLGNLGADAPGRSRRLAELAAGVTLASLLFVVTPSFLSDALTNNDTKASQAVRAPFIPTLAAIDRADLAPNKSVWIISEHTKGFEYWVLRYELTADSTAPNDTWSLGTPLDKNDVWTRPKTAAQFGSDLQAYDYVVVHHTDATFNSEFGSLFANVADLKDASVFRVEKTGSSVKLVKIAG